MGKRNARNKGDMVLAQPDMLAGPDANATSAQEGIRLILDDAALRLALFSPVENAVFFAVHVDGLSERQAAAKLHRSPKEVRLAIDGIRRVVRRTIARVEAGLPPLLQKQGRGLDGRPPE